MARKGYKQSAAHVRSRIRARLRTLRHKERGATATQLRRWYCREGLTCVDIGHRVQRDPKTVWAWMRFYGIPTRPRGSNSDQLPRGREPGFHLSDEHKAALRARRLADSHVPYLRNGRHWLAGQASHLHPNWKGGHTPERQAFYAGEAWKRACRVVWKRANATCERCHTRHNGLARGTFHVHHVVPFAVVALRAKPSNLRLLCAPCHRFVHSRRNTTKEMIRAHS